MNADDINEAGLTISDEESRAAMQAFHVIRGLGFDNLGGVGSPGVGTATIVERV